MIKLVPIDAVKASEYNPRRNDEKRLALAELSLRKLGFLETQPASDRRQRILKPTDRMVGEDHRWLMNQLRKHPEVREAYRKHMAFAAALHGMAKAWVRAW